LQQTEEILTKQWRLTVLQVTFIESNEGNEIPPPTAIEKVDVHCEDYEFNF